MPDTNGLSILIPVFNHAVRPLVQELHAQLADWPGPVEILCLDDGSSEEYRQLNRPLAALPGLRYEELPANVGRAACRNRLAARAQQQWLLLLDNDGRLPDAHFLKRYADARHRAPVLEGGISYAPTPPAEADLQLRYRYATAREARPAAVRQRAPYSQLMLNNLLIQAAVYRRFPLNEQLRHYGHEDTQLGWNLRRAAVPVLRLDNPVRHDEGLEPAAGFLEKSRHAVRNLVLLYRAQHEKEGVGMEESRLLRLALRLRQLGLARAARAALQAAAPRLRRNLLSADPDLRQFDLLRLLWTLLELEGVGNAPATFDRGN
ncbi:glycosyltransferase family 2 protein [uncultured Hymenobacter sp.]|uniref:glycosyltransferase family 2 protein n=1 Tax=uncultured Hymenobacter sp. TaxID=170016 RepID=UPI0035CC9759